jgi:hypothetical protein
MNKLDIKKLNVVPEGKAPWLSYENYTTLGQLFDRVDPPDQPVIDGDYAALYKFLVSVAGLELPIAADSIHFNAFTLLRRGYKVEEITETEYKDLIRLMDGVEQPDKNDMDLYDTGGHRELYDYLTRQMGLFVEAGRGPVWYRARSLIEHYDIAQQPMVSWRE